MKTLLALPLIALTAGCMAERPMEMSAAAQSQLSEELRGRVQAGPTQSCVSSRTLGGNESVGEGAIIFRTMGTDLVYVNRPPAGCPEIGPGRAIRVRTTTTRFCAGDIAEVFDPSTGFSYGACGLGEFTPYRRQR
ncbi:MAG: hypothetical protein M3N39_05655 [Pseudomonadota bacterium]|nr:hypothetical protein [Pseudomonadota bacterium]